MENWTNLRNEFPKEYQRVSVSVNGYHESFKGYMYTQQGTGYLFFIKDNGDYWQPKSNHHTYWKNLN